MTRETTSMPTAGAVPAFRTAGQAGFTLLELLIVLAILALLAALAGPPLIGYLSRAKSDTARLQIDQLQTSLDLFRLDVGRYPTKEEGLGALMTPPANVPKWAGPYLRSEDGLRDPWGYSYRYEFPGTHGVYDLYSLGADNAEGGEGENADAANWTRASQ